MRASLANLLAAELAEPPQQVPARHQSIITGQMLSVYSNRQIKTDRVSIPRQSRGL